MEGEAFRVKHLSGGPEGQCGLLLFPVPVLPVTYHRMAHIRHVYPDLVRAAGFSYHAHEADLAKNFR